MSHYVLIALLDVNSLKSNFSILSCTFHVHSALKEYAGDADNLQFYSKNKHDKPYFSSRYFNKNNASFQWQFYDQRRRKLYHTLLGHRKSVGRIFPDP